jgi:hypothetical protein
LFPSESCNNFELSDVPINFLRDQKNMYRIFVAFIFNTKKFERIHLYDYILMYRQNILA